MSLDIKTALEHLLDRQDLSEQQMQDVMQSIMTGECSDAQIAGFLVALRMKGETVDEITGAARTMRELATPVEIDVPHLVDTCGTGGDGAKTFNISTVSAVVSAAAGAKVAKHGNRSVSSSSGSADLLEKAGVRLDIGPDQVANCIKDIGVGFMFAPMHHSAMKHAIGPRRELGIRTVFNLLGPLTNPARCPNQVMGVFSEAWLKPIAQVLQRLGSQHVMVVHGTDGMDEISICAPTKVAELRDGEISEYEINPTDFDMALGEVSSLAVSDANASLEKIWTVLKNEPGPAADIVALNAGAAIYVSGVASSLSEGVQMAQDAIGSGLAAEKMRELASMTTLMQDSAD